MGALVLALVLSQDGGSGLPLPEVLRRLGDAAAAREAAAPCTYHEVTVVEELGEGGVVKGSEERVYEGELHGIEVTKRERTSLTKKGEALSDLLVEPKNAKGRKPAKSPFLPAMRSQFQFALKDGPAAGLMTVTLEPVKSDPERPRGEAVVRASDARIETFSFSPSKAPLLLESLKVTLKFDDTACGRVATVIESEGVGQALIIETKFRTRTVVSGHALIGSQPRSR